MRISLSLALLAGFFISSCSNVDEPPPGAHYRAANYPPAREQYPPPEQPFNPNAGPPPTSPEHAEENPQTAVQATPAPAPNAPATKVAKGDYPYAMPVPGKPGIVYSPYVPDKQVDVRGMAPGSEVKDPYTDYKKIFLVP